MGRNKDSSEQPANWTLWKAKDVPPINGKGRRWKLKCSCCLRELEVAVIFPEHGLRICLECVQRICSSSTQAPSSIPEQGPGLKPDPDLSRGDTDKEV